MELLQNKKHAYLIMAHNNFPQLQILISLLDDPRNDIYLHIDKKTKHFQPESISIQHSNLVLIDRISVNWGGHSQVTCELNLLKAAIPKHYQYYHLLSGVDLPLKTQDQIHAFFEVGYPNNYIDFDKVANQTRDFLSRISQYYFFQDAIGRNSSLLNTILKRMEYFSLLLQGKLGIFRKQYIQAYKGANWFSITDALAQYIIAHEKLIKKQFYNSLGADEIFLHSIAMSSPYCKDIIEDNLRAIDWKRGSPYIYRQEDVEELLHSSNFFARKFDINVDFSAIEKIVLSLSNNGKSVKNT